MLFRSRFTVFGEIGFEQIALRLAFALKRAQLHVLLIGLRGHPLDLIEAGSQRFEAVAGDLGVVVERARQSFRFGAQLAVAIDDLRLQFLDARMQVEQRGGLLGKLRLQYGALVGKPPQRTKAAQVAISSIGNFFGNSGFTAGVAREMMRASGGAALMLSRAAASRYFAR